MEELLNILEELDEIIVELESSDEKLEVELESGVEDDGQ